MAATNKRLLISESRGIRIDVHPAGKNPINKPHAFHAQFTYGLRPYISHCPRRQPFASPHQDETCPYTREKSWQPKTDWPGVLGHLILPPSQQPWSRGERFRPISDTSTSAYWAHNTSMQSIRLILARGGQPIGP
jgi:hypothetical protein